MGYQRGKLVELAVELVRQQPGLTAAAASDRLGVHRHTLQRALKASGLSFAWVRQAIVLECLERHFTGAQAESLKGIWTELGFASSSAFARYIRRTTGKSPSELRAGSILARRHGKGPK